MTYDISQASQTSSWSKMITGSSVGLAGLFVVLVVSAVAFTLIKTNGSHNTRKFIETQRQSMMKLVLGGKYSASYQNNATTSNSAAETTSTVQTLSTQDHLGDSLDMSHSKVSKKRQTIEEAQCSVEHLTLEQLMNQAMKQIAQTMSKKTTDNNGELVANGVECQNYLVKKIAQTLPKGWEVGVTVHGRIYYIE